MTPFGLGVRAIAAYNLARFMRLRVAGAEHLPSSGPALVAARHYHHLFDGAALVMGLRRQPHIFVALDWTRSFWGRLAMETVCNLADWPVALRADNVHGRDGAFSAAEIERYVRRAIAQSADLLARGEVLAVFPEAYPTIDPAGGRKASDDTILPFARGVWTIAARAERRTRRTIPIVPAGLHYRSRGAGRYDVTLRLGSPLFLRDASDRTDFLTRLRERVLILSA